MAVSTFCRGRAIASYELTVFAPRQGTAKGKRGGRALKSEAHRTFVQPLAGPVQAIFPKQASLDLAAI